MDRRLRIVCVDHLAVSSTGRGLYRALGRRGVDLTVVVPPTWRENFSRIATDPPLRDDPFRLTVVPVIFPGKSNRCLHPGLGRLLGRLRPDVVFLQSEPEDLLLTSVLLTRWLRRLSFKIVFMSWRNIPYRRFGIPYKWPWVYEAAQALNARRGDCTLAYNREAVNLMKDLGCKSVHYMPFAIDTEVFASDEPDGKSIKGQSCFTVGLFGRLVAEKGGATLLEAMAGLSPVPRLILAGDGPARESWLNMAATLGIADRVSHLGVQPRAKLPEIIRQCDIVAVPSYTTASWKEQFGRIIVEAMACGVPVVGSDCGEIPSVVADAGIIFPQRDVAALRAAIARLMQSPALRLEMSRAGRARARAVYSCEVAAARWLEIFTDLVSGAGTAKRVTGDAVGFSST